MDMYEITLNVMYTAAVLVAMFTAIMVVFKLENTDLFLAKFVVYLGWVLSASASIASLIVLIWVK